MVARGGRTRRPRTVRVVQCGMRTKVLGLTGTIGAGKSTVAGMLRELGAVVIDADALARAALEREEVRREIAAAFGPETIADDGHVDRAALAARAFDDAEARRRLEAIVHPRVAEARAEAERRARSAAPPPPLIVHDVPLLFETGMDRSVDAVWVVDAPWSVRVRRLERRSGLSAEEAAGREAAQWPAARKRAAGDRVIENEADLETLRARVRAAWEGLVEVGDDDGGPADAP